MIRPRLLLGLLALSVITGGVTRVILSPTDDRLSLLAKTLGPTECLTDSDCYGNDVCFRRDRSRDEVGECTAKSCKTRSDCKENYTCESNGRCTAGKATTCVTSLGCAIGWFCAYGKCSKGSTWDCSSKCKDERELCVIGGSYRRKCPAGSECVDEWKCVDAQTSGRSSDGDTKKVSPNYREGEKCWNDGDCISNFCKGLVKDPESGNAMQLGTCTESDDAQTGTDAADRTFATAEETHATAQGTWEDAQTAWSDARETWNEAKDAYAAAKQEYADEKTLCADEEDAAARTECKAAAKANLNASKTAYNAAKITRTEAKSAYTAARTKWRAAEKTFKKATKEYGKATGR